jgi:hypothetical protein
MMLEIWKRNKILFWLGAVHLFIFLLLLLYYPFNTKVVLGINSVIKPMKFALSIWLYAWTMAMIVHYISDQKKVKVFAWVVVVCMCFEQLAITSQALRGQLSHFNKNSLYGTILFSAMGVFILTATLWTAYIAFVFSKQKVYALSSTTVLAIKIGLLYFVVFSLFGGYISSLQGHTVGATDGMEGLWFLNWSKFFGDLRVAHFFGIHSLQIIPFFAICLNISSKSEAHEKLYVRLFSFTYLAFIVFVMIQGLKGIAFIQM